MLTSILLSFLILSGCVVIQSLFVAAVVLLLFKLDEVGFIKFSVVRNSYLLALITLIMLTGILIQILIWALCFMILGEFDNLGDAFYHSTVNFTTLGYGDLVMSPQRRVLGALEAASGVLMFGMTSSVLFAFIAMQFKRRWVNQSDNTNASQPKA